MDGHGGADPVPEPIEVRGATRAPHEPPDRLAWRARLKSHPTTRAWFRVAVAVFGVMLMIAAPAFGVLPGPGGLPLFLLGLAVLATEFHWARRFNKWLVRRMRAYLNWDPTHKRWLWFGVFMVFVVLTWVYLLVLGVPAWAPGWAARVLGHLPWVS